MKKYTVASFEMQLASTNDPREREAIRADFDRKARANLIEKEEAKPETPPASTEPETLASFSARLESCKEPVARAKMLQEFDAKAKAGLITN